MRNHKYYMFTRGGGIYLIKSVTRYFALGLKVIKRDTLFHNMHTVLTSSEPWISWRNIETAWADKLEPWTKFKELLYER